VHKRKEILDTLEEVRDLIGAAHAQMKHPGVFGESEAEAEALALGAVEKAESLLGAVAAELREERGERHDPTGNPGNPGRPPLTEQTVLFDRERWTVQAARAWLKEHGKHFGQVVVKDARFHFRQRDPGDFRRGSFRTVALGEGTGVQAVMGHLKE